MPGLQISGMETFLKTMDNVEAGDQVGLLVKGIRREDVKRGMAAIKPGSLQPASLVKAQIYRVWVVKIMIWEFRKLFDFSVSHHLDFLPPRC